MLKNNLVPIVVEETRHGERSFDIFSRLLKDRIIFLTGQIDMQSANLLIAQMLFLEKENDKKDIYLYINSPGGAVTASFAIYDTMQHIKPDVATVGVGLAASGGSLLLTAGATGKRSVLPNAKVMIHEPNVFGGGLEGSLTDLEIMMENFKNNKDNLIKIYQKHTGQSIKQIKEDMSIGDKWLNAQQARKYGLIDKVL